MDTIYTNSGIALLCLGILDNWDKSDEIAWNNTLLIKTKSCKGNIVGSGKEQHFNLDVGYY